MKFILIATFIMSSLSSFAATVGSEAVTVSRLLLYNPEVVAKLSAKNIRGLYDFDLKDLGNGVTKFTLKYNRDCFCLPAEAVVTILEDVRPTYQDGPALYKATVTIKE